MVLKVLRFLLDATHVLRTDRETTIALVMKSPRLVPPLRWLLGKRSMFELFSHLSCSLGDWIDSIVYREVVIEVDGQKMFGVMILPSLVDNSAGKRLDPEDGLLIYEDGYEPPVSSHFCSLLKPDTKVVDVGASLGYYTLLAAKRVREVIAFEPNPFRFKYLRKTVQINNWKNVRVCELFVSDYDSLEKKTVTLDSIADGANVVKIDVEGMELQVLKGMEKILSEGTQIICELHPKALPANGMGEISSLLRRHGYAFYLITHQGLKKVPDLLGDNRRHYYFVRGRR
ncbi:hypothetical protein ES703_54094 [subsurface metagenome]